jgi:hypothetical protein
MKVICTNEDAYPNGVDMAPEEGIIKNGEVYEVVDAYLDKGYLFFILSIDPEYGYWEDCFSRC